MAITYSIQGYMANTYIIHGYMANAYIIQGYKAHTYIIQGYTESVISISFFSKLGCAQKVKKSFDLRADFF